MFIYLIVHFLQCLPKFGFIYLVTVTHKFFQNFYQNCSEVICWSLVEQKARADILTHDIKLDWLFCGQIASSGVLEVHFSPLKILFAIININGLIIFIRLLLVRWLLLLLLRLLRLLVFVLFYYGFWFLFWLLLICVSLLIFLVLQLLLFL